MMDRTSIFLFSSELNIEQNIASKLANIKRNRIINLVHCKLTVEFFHHIIILNDTDMRQILALFHRK